MEFDSAASHLEARATKEEEVEMNEPTHRTAEASDVESSSDSDDSAAPGERAFGAFKAAGEGALSERGTAMTSIRRSNSWTSFLTRSERFHEKPDVPPSPQEMAKRKVQFRDDTELAAIRIMEQLEPPLSDTEKDSYYMTNDDMDRTKVDIKMALMRWDNHENGHIEFDDNQHSVRGLIDHVDEACPPRNRDEKMYLHSTGVLQEQNRQRHTGTYLNAEQIAQVAALTAWEEAKRAVRIAQVDREAAEEASKANLVMKASFGIKSTEKKEKRSARKGKDNDKPKADKKDKKKGLGKLAFWSK
jgi:hypothetical protein